MQYEKQAFSDGQTLTAANMNHMEDGIAELERRFAAHESGCIAKHFVTTIEGNGEESLSFHVPFEPDALLVINYDTLNRYTNYTVQAFIADLRALGLLAGNSFTSRSTGAPYVMTMTTTSLLTRYSRAEDGTVTLRNISAVTGYGRFAQGVNYSVTAVKYTDKTDKELFTDLVNRLEGSGTVEVCQAKAEAAFTDEEWQSLIATKPDWTFTFV